MFCRSNDKGFTLIEILVAITLFAFGALLAARMQTTGVRSTTFGKEALQATIAAQALMEQLKEQPSLGNFGTVSNNGALAGPAPVRPDNTPANVLAGTGGILARPFPDMTIQWQAANTTGTVGTRYTTVTVTVRWAGNTRSYATTTVISES